MMYAGPTKKTFSKGDGLHYQCNFFLVDVIDEDHNDCRELLRVY